jgi:NitT/TauT family transport system substrate-binding protein
MPSFVRSVLIAACALLAVVVPPSLRAEVGEVRLARQYGLPYLPLMIMEHDRLIEKHAKAAGLGELKTTWSAFASSALINDAMFAERLDVALTGVPAVITLWARTRGTPQEVRGLVATGAHPMALVTREPRIKSLRDFAEGDRIAVPTVKTSNAALAIQMEAERLFGPGQHAKLDALTIGRGHPDAMASLLSGRGEINAHFSNQPFLQAELVAPGIRPVMTLYQALGGPASLVAAYATVKFHDANPKVIAAVLAAIEEATERINRDRRGSAEIYLKLTNDKKTTVDELVKLIADPDTIFTTAPQNTMVYAEFMHRIGLIKVKPQSWKDLFFPSAHKLAGS